MGWGTIIALAMVQHRLPTSGNNAWAEVMVGNEAAVQVAAQLWTIVSFSAGPKSKCLSHARSSDAITVNSARAGLALDSITLQVHGQRMRVLQLSDLLRSGFYGLGSGAGAARQCLFNSVGRS